MTTPAVSRGFHPVALSSLLIATLLAAIAITAAVLGGSRVHCPSASDSSPSRPLAAACAPTP